MWVFIQLKEMLRQVLSVKVYRFVILGDELCTLFHIQFVVPLLSARINLLWLSYSRCHVHIIAFVLLVYINSWQINWPRTIAVNTFFCLLINHSYHRHHHKQLRHSYRHKPTRSCFISTFSTSPAVVDYPSLPLPFLPVLSPQQKSQSKPTATSSLKEHATSETANA